MLPANCDCSYLIRHGFMSVVMSIHKMLEQDAKKMFMSFNR